MQSINFYHYDDIGNVIFIADTSRNKIVDYVQEGFGNVLAVVGSLTTENWHLTTKEQDPVTGLYYFVCRWYDPVMGRWITEEPTGADGLNLYHYCFNDPINNADINGLWIPPWHVVHGTIMGLRNGLSIYTALGLGAEEMLVDFLPGSSSMDPTSTHMHAMGGQIPGSNPPKYETPSEAKNGTKNLVACSSFLDPIADHATIDSYVHDYQQWKGWTSIPYTIKHIFADTIPTSSKQWGALLSGTSKLNE
ncbi:MAG: RHS repeat domain-containing protein [bacterium]